MIGYYAHSHGSGHCNCAQLFAQIMGNNLTIFTDRDYPFTKETQVIRLPNENPNGQQFDRRHFKEPPSLHYAPVNMRKITLRNQKILTKILEGKIQLLIVDVSVEIAMLARVSSVPYAYVRLQGNRMDLPHTNAFKGATFLLAYFPEEMESKSTPDWVRKKTVYLGFISKFMFNKCISERPKEYRFNGKPNFLYLTGFGGSQSFDFRRLSDEYNVYAVGPGRVCNAGVLTAHIGIVKCTRTFIEHADVIMAGCGANTTSEILSLNKRFIAISERRPYNEQELMSAGLEKMEWAVSLKKYESLHDAIARLRQFNRKPLTAFTADTFVNFCSVLASKDFRADEIFIRLEKKERSLKPFMNFRSLTAETTKISA